AGVATLARVEPDGSVHEAARDLRLPNGMVFLDDERTLVVAETLGLRLTAFEVEPLGRLKGRRLWASTADGPNGPVAPDGIAADPQGGIWVANGVGAECLRFDEGGEVTAHVETRQPCFACALGGEDGRTLFCMTAPSPVRGEVEGRGLGTIEVGQV
ncbi:MAG: SMP-30/gluconolactonase/LRE family protein, partial [Actinomycetota bacterium]|nr:SMP-30/gluconolactonase/LRE family protein [Actinomycetota bacterium]